MTNKRELELEKLWDGMGVRHKMDELSRYLQQRYADGIPGERDQLLLQLENEGLPRYEADEVVQLLEGQGFAHYLEAEKRWRFTRYPLNLDELLGQLAEEYRGYTGHTLQPLEEATEFIATKLAVDKDVAREVLEVLEAAGYASVGYDADYQRNRVLFRQP